MDSITQWMLPPGAWKEAEETAQRLLDALTKDNLLVDFVALEAACRAYLLRSEFPAQGLAKFYQQVHGIDSPHSTWEEFEASSADFIDHIAIGLEFPQVGGPLIGSTGQIFGRGRTHPSCAACAGRESTPVEPADE